MKKLLSILTISTLTASVPAPLLANTVQTRVKRDVSTLTFNSNNEYLPIKEINGITGKIISLAVDSKNKIYFGVYQNGAYVLKQGSTTPTKVDGTSGQINSLAVDTKNKIYFGTDSRAYKLQTGKNTATKIDGITFAPVSLAVDSNNNLYFGTDNGAFVLKHGATTPTKINGINGRIKTAVDSKDNIYFGTKAGAYKLQTALSWTKTQSQFTLVDSTKMQTWTRPDLLSVDGELNIDIANPNIDKVVFDNVEQSQTNKHWTINVKPETSEKDHNLQVMFTLDGKQYTSEIIISMQAKIDPQATLVQQNLSDLIKTTDSGNILDNNDDTIFAAVNQKNSNVIDDFSQIEISKQDNLAVVKSKKPILKT